MDNSKQAPSPNEETTEARMQKIVVLRWGHRPQRDVRLTTHVALTARALGASGFLLSDTVDEKIKETIEKVTESWGGKFSFEMGTSWKKAVKDWKTKGGVVVHLTAYGENIQTSNVLEKIRNLKKDVLVIVGSQKSRVNSFQAMFLTLMWPLEINRIQSALPSLCFWTGFLREKHWGKRLETRE